MRYTESDTSDRCLGRCTYWSWGYGFNCGIKGQEQEQSVARLTSRGDSHLEHQTS
jgi:hypothetical protein